MPVESELERGARMKSVGILSPSYTLLYRYMHFLENQVRYVAYLRRVQGREAAGPCQLCVSEPLVVRAVCPRNRRLAENIHGRVSSRIRCRP